MNIKQIKEKRLTLNLTQKELAQRTGYSLASIRKMEQGKMTISKKFQIIIEGLK